MVPLVVTHSHLVWVALVCIGLVLASLFGAVCVGLVCLGLCLFYFFACWMGGWVPCVFVGRWVVRGMATHELLDLL